MNIQERLGIFCERLQAAAPAANAQDALALVCRLIEEVEDELCPLPRQESGPLDFTGRMYPPKSDRVRPGPDGGLVATTRRHRIHCFVDGGITVIHMQTRRIEVTTKGKET